MSANRLTYLQLLARCCEEVEDGYMLLKIDPSYQPWVKAIAVDLGSKFPSFDFEAFDSTNHWPTIFVEDK